MVNLCRNDLVVRQDLFEGFALVETLYVTSLHPFCDARQQVGARDITSLAGF